MLKTPKECFDENYSVHKAHVATGLSANRIQNLYSLYRIDTIITRAQNNSDRINEATKLEAELLELIERTRGCLTPQIDGRIEYLKKQFALFCA